MIFAEGPFGETVKAFDRLSSSRRRLQRLVTVLLESSESSSHDPLQAQSLRHDCRAHTFEQFAVTEPQDQDNDRCASTSLRQQQRNNRPRWIEKVTKLKPLFVLEDSGSVARDHVAVERTFLAGVRTSLGLGTMGVSTSFFFECPVCSI